MIAALRVVLFTGLLLAAGGVAAAQRALLVGVSELAYQPPSMWLQAPRNDVLLMRQALQKHGFAASDITTLADGVSGAALPEAQAIQDALARLLAQSKSGDFVLLYFSGHGTRLRDANKRYQEPDGLAENFLARDVRGAIGSGAPLPGGVRDVDFDAWIGAFLARNVFVWAVYDTCSAASMTRSARVGADAPQPADDEVRFRGVRAEQLARSASTAAAPAATAQTAPGAAAVPRARYVAFFASESHQVTPELRLPRKDRAARAQGLLTWAVSEALQRKPATWRDLFNGVLALYPPVIEELESRFPERELPSPVAEGNLDTALFSNTAAPVSTRPVWRAQRAGNSLALEIGQLDGLEPQQDVRVLATQADGTVRSAPVRITQVALSSARLEVPAALAASPNAVQWSLTPATEPAAAALRVASDRELPDGLALGYPAAIRRVRATDDTADVRWTDAGAGQARLDILSPTLAGWFGPGARGALLSGTPALRERLQSLAQLKWLLRLQSLAEAGQVEGFEAVLEVWDGQRLVRSGALPAGERAPPLAANERLALRVRNASGHSLDLVVVGVDAQGAFVPVFPQENGESNRFERGTREQPASKRFALPWAAANSAGRLLVIASPAAAQSAPRLFGIGAADPAGELRVRGQPAPEAPRAVFAAIARWD
ncbi:MAG: caspase family protein [Variovorax sp.]|nr:MAG: caspase family protein [Variovorax sp.]